MAMKSCPCLPQHRGQGRRGFDPSRKDHGWTKEELAVVCDNCKQIFGHHGGYKPHTCPGGGGTNFVAPLIPYTLAEVNSLKKETDDFKHHTGKCAFPSCEKPLEEIVGWAMTSDKTKFVACQQHVDYYTRECHYKFTDFPTPALSEVD